MQESNQYSEDLDLLFVYGTLMQADNIYGLYLKDNSELVGKAKLRAKLYDIGTYPGALAIANDNSYTFGFLLRLKKPEEALRLLDEYEGFGETELQPNEFIREAVEVECNEGPTICWTYLYNHPVEDLFEIKSGDYKGFLEQGA